MGHNSSALCTFLMPMAPAIERGFSTHGAGNPFHEVANSVVVDHADEIGHRQAGFLRLHARGELVAEVADRGLAHAGDAQVLAQHGRDLDVEVVERARCGRCRGCGPGS